MSKEFGDSSTSTSAQEGETINAGGSSKEVVAARHPIDEALTTFLNGLNGIQKSFSVLMPHVANWINDEFDGLEKKYKGYKVSSKDSDEHKFQFAQGTSKSLADMLAFRRTLDDLTSVDYRKVLTQSLFTQIFCSFDSYIGALLSAIYKCKPSLYSALDRKISISELRTFNSIDSATEFLFDAEIDAFRRGSYVEQFLSLENRFDVPLRKFKEWADFVELGQRRNLLIHNGGMVSEQYRTVCKREGHAAGAAAQIGSILEIDTSYLSSALLVMRKVAFMLSHTLWRKVLPQEMDAAHNACHSTVYSFLQKKMWNTAAQLGEFSLSQMNCKNLTDQHRRMRVINTAIGFKFAGKQEECKRVIEAEDWSSSYRDFRLAVAVLTDNLEEVWLQMRQIGKKGEMLEAWAYRDWPLFHDLRLNKDFHAIFEEIYEEPFVSEDPALTDVVLPEHTKAVLDSPPEAVKAPRRRVVTPRRATMNPASIPGPTTEPAPKRKSPRKQ